MTYLVNKFTLGVKSDMIREQNIYAVNAQCIFLCKGNVLYFKKKSNTKSIKWRENQFFEETASFNSELEIYKAKYI